MLPLFDMMLRAQNGAGMEAIAKQFNLAQEQATQAMAALMPAFSSGFKRTSANPYDLTSLMSSMVSGAYGKYFEDLTKAFTPQGTMDGNAVLEKLFGSKEVSRAIAAQAEQLTGIGQEVFKKMMPAMADTLMGGLFKQMSGQMTGANEAFAASPMGQMQQQWLESMGLQPKAKPQAAANPFDNPFAQAMRSMWGLDKPEQPQPSSGNPFADNPFAKAFQDMMGGAFTSPSPAAAPTPEKSKEAPADEPNPYRDVLNNMFDSGLEVQKSYQKNMEAIFDTYLRNGTGGNDEAAATPAAPKPSK
ncbi:DUF937 domain-containing protein [Neorhizobium sp. T25_13]|uniref:DUF937 domain-containing protein n=1 Tax=Neorhizobium sp. T25_13 TaxID=2093830 RepID=UPI000CFA543C|nr:DUF937 domain-containing protein [Neorhizobium sp. T25_13]